MSVLKTAKSAIESEIAHLESQLSRLQQSLLHLSSAIDQTAAKTAGGLPAVTSKVQKTLKAQPKSKAVAPVVTDQKKNAVAAAKPANKSKPAIKTKPATPVKKSSPKPSLAAKKPVVKIANPEPAAAIQAAPPEVATIEA